MRKTWLILAVCFMASPAWAQAGGMAQRIAALDLNGDGAITRAEAREARAIAFDRADINGDGQLSEAERNAMGNGQGGRMRGGGFGDADANNDGRISRDEAMSAPYRAFDRLDSNNDGVISSQEMQAVRRFGG